MKLLVGLGNPGLKYAKTRHNVGFMVLDELAKESGVKLNKHKAFQGEYNEITVDGERILLLKPQTYMNRSGRSVQAIVDYFGIESADILVIYDDLDLAVGVTKFRKTGGHGGHNGLRSLIDHLDTKAFNRARIGIGRPREGQSVTSHVLARFSKEERKEIENVQQYVTKACKAWMEADFDYVMNQYN
ncbi:aminoacyl-tRNA hydrolase [Natribacillus halophilus]|uniref:Peptidyl-tRNA hydrolase n=1 Tax=Natribacillus halophilus TaxID=549003 RepID=A0A1G8RJL0_9BACI|nr:aminoacyl-tRNA hydrolase [Natribacillus halophilus]SDJ17129.1 peptidyl-tRNA hydrolase [Natribacillus halophilus]